MGTYKFDAWANVDRLYTGKIVSTKEIHVKQVSSEFHLVLFK